MTLHLTEPVHVFPDCRLWLASFNHEQSASASNREADLDQAKLTSRDLVRWQQFRPAEKKQQFLNSRLAVRAVLQREFAEAAEEIQFDSDPHGRPVLTVQEGPIATQISLSHSRNAIAVVISNNEFPIGVDIEVVAKLHSEALRLIAFHPDEQSWCDNQTGRESDALATLWTVKESVWKTLHQEHSIPIASISIEFDGGILSPRVSNPEFADAVFRLQLFTVDCEPIMPDTLRLPPSFSTFRGCVTQRLSPEQAGPGVRDK